MDGKKREPVNGKDVKAEKRRKFELKQEKKQQVPLDANGFTEDESSWLESEKKRVWQLSFDDITRIRSVGHIGGLSQLVIPYCNLQDHEIIEHDGKRLFIAEGTETVRCLLQQELVQPLSIFLKPNLFLRDPVRLRDDVEKAWERGSECKVLLGTEAVLSKVAGFPVTRGVLGCGIVPDYDEEWLMRFVEENSGRRLRIVAFDGISDTANLGSIIRTSAAFSVDAILLSHNSCDAWYRKSVRVSMGTIFQLPIIRVKNLAKSLKSLLASGICSYASSLDSKALSLKSIDQESILNSWCLVLGNEGTGISEETRRAATFTIRIDIGNKVDSLGVATAAGILIHGLVERETN